MVIKEDPIKCGIKSKLYTFQYIFLFTILPIFFDVSKYTIFFVNKLINNFKLI